MASIQLPRDLRRYEDDLVDALRDAIDDQEDHDEDAIADLRLDERKLGKVVGQIFQILVEEDDMDERDAAQEAAELVVDASIYRTLENRRRLKDIPRDLEDDLRDAADDLEDMVQDSGRSRRRDGGRDRNERSRRDRADSRREASGTATRNRGKKKDDGEGSSRRGGRRDRDDADARRHEREERKAARKNGDSQDAERDANVSKAKANLDLNKEVVVTKASFAEWAKRSILAEDVFALPIAPVYYLGSQYLTIKDGQFYSNDDKGTDVFNYDEHRTDLFLRTRTKIKPSVSLRAQAIDNAREARAEYIDELIAAANEAQNAVQGDIAHKELDQALIIKDKVVVTYGEDTSSLDVLRQCLSDYGVRGIPKHVVVAKAMMYPTWVMSEQLTTAVEDMIKCDRISELPQLLWNVNNFCTDEQWKFFHDRLTSLINDILATVIHTQAYLTSVLTEWDKFGGWLEKYKGGAFITWFNNNLASEMQKAFRIEKSDSEFKHAFCDGSVTNFASVGNMRNIIYLPVSSDNFMLACPTKVGQIHKSLTPDLYWLTTNHFSDKCYQNMIVTSSNDFIQLYSRPNAVENRNIFVAGGF